MLGSRSSGVRSDVVGGVHLRAATATGVDETQRRIVLLIRSHTSELSSSTLSRREARRFCSQNFFVSSVMNSRRNQLWPLKAAEVELQAELREARRYVRRRPQPHAR